MADGSLVVLTADRILTAGYPLLLDGMAAASLTTTTPRWLFDRLMTPQGPAAIAPLGLRRVEGALLAGGFARDAVTVANEARLDAAIGPATRVVGISSGDPRGAGMHTTTMAAIMGGRPWTQAGFQRVLARVRRLVAACAPQARVVVGGPGAWQIAAGLPGVDAVVQGYCEDDIAARMRAWCGLPASTGTVAHGISPLPGPACMGAVELSRGCGLGCAYCTIAATPMRHLAPDAVLADVRVNLAGGQRHAALLSEDALRYGAQGFAVRPDALLSLLADLRRLPGLGLIQIDHANLASVARWSDGELGELARLLAGAAAAPPWINVGVESADGALLAAHGGTAKLGGCPPAQWGAFAAQQVRRLVAAGFFPFASLLLGLPGETPAQVAATAAWTESLLRDRALAGRLGVFPLFYAPLDGASPPRPTRAHWRLLAACWREDFPRMANLYAAQQRAAGVPTSRRALTALLGRAQAMQWRGLFAWHGWRAAA